MENKQKVLKRIEELIEKDNVFIAAFAKNEGDVALDGCLFNEDFNDLECRGLAQLMVEQISSKGVRLDSDIPQNDIKSVLEKALHTFKDDLNKLKEAK